MADADVIVVLGAAVRPDGTPSKALIRRARHAARLYSAGSAAWVVVSGGRTVPRHAGGRPAPWPECRAMRDLLIRDGVPADHIVEESEATRTLENAIRVRAVMAARGWSRALLVTDDYHLPRALMTFRAAGIRCRASAARGVWREEGLARSVRIIVREAGAILSYAMLILAGRLSRG